MLLSSGEMCLELSVMLGYVVLYAQFKGGSLGEEELGESCVVDGIEILLASAERLELGLSVGGIGCCCRAGRFAWN